MTGNKLNDRRPQVEPNQENNDVGVVLRYVVDTRYYFIL